MKSALLVLIDAGPLVAYFDCHDDWHDEATEFIGAFKGQFVTSAPVITEVMWLLRSDYRVQNEFLRLVSGGVIHQEALTAPDFGRIAELNTQYADLPADIADLSLLVIAERRNIHRILTLDADFQHYRVKRGQRVAALERILLKDDPEKG